jgi:hypothetical protein
MRPGLYVRRFKTPVLQGEGIETAEVFFDFT